MEDIRKRLKAVERILKRHQRRLSKVVTAVIPPLPIGGYFTAPDEGGVLMRYIFAASGTISKGYIKVEELAQGAKSVEIIGELTKQGTKEVFEFQVGQGLRMIELGRAVEGGTQLTLRCNEKGAHGFWIGFLYHIVEGIEVEQRMIDSLLTLEEKYSAEDEEDLR